MTGPIYGLQTGGHDWYTTGRKYLTEVMGFDEGKNVPSTYAIDTGKLSNDERAATFLEKGPVMYFFSTLRDIRKQTGARGRVSCSNNRHNTLRNWRPQARTRPSIL